MKRILVALWGMMVVVLLGLSSSDAQPFYQSDLTCAFGFETSPRHRGYHSAVPQPLSTRSQLMRTQSFLPLRG